MSKAGRGPTRPRDTQKNTAVGSDNSLGVDGGRSRSGLEFRKPGGGGRGRTGSSVDPALSKGLRPSLALAMKLFSPRAPSGAEAPLSDRQPHHRGFMRAAQSYSQGWQCQEGPGRGLKSTPSAAVLSSIFSKLPFRRRAGEEVRGCQAGVTICLSHPGTLPLKHKNLELT